MCSGLKSNDKHIPVILYSASNLGKKVLAEYKAEFIPKSFDSDQFLAAVHKLTNDKNQESAWLILNEQPRIHAINLSNVQYYILLI